jgi:hypothetical protein
MGDPSDQPDEEQGNESTGHDEEERAIEPAPEWGYEQKGLNNGISDTPIFLDFWRVRIKSSLSPVPLTLPEYLVYSITRTPFSFSANILKSLRNADCSESVSTPMCSDLIDLKLTGPICSMNPSA